MDPKDPVHRELALSGADLVLSTGTCHPAHIAVIDISQALALRLTLFAGVQTSHEQDNYRSSNQDTSGSVGLGAVGSAEYCPPQGST